MPARTVTYMHDYTDTDLIRYAYQHPRRTAGKLTGIRESFGLSETRFLLAVNQVLDSPQRVAALDPATAALARRLDVQRARVAEMRRPA